MESMKRNLKVVQQLMEVDEPLSEQSKEFIQETVQKAYDKLSQLSNKENRRE